MSDIKTNLHTAATDDQGNVDLSGERAFSSVFKLGFILGNQDPHNKKIPTDEKGLQDVKENLESMAFECFSALAGIGAIVAVANPQALIESDLERLGIAIKNLSLLGMEAQDHIESIEMDLSRRNTALTAQSVTAHSITQGCACGSGNTASTARSVAA